MKRKMVWTGISFIAGMFFASVFNKEMQIPVMLSVLLVSAFLFQRAGKKFKYFAVSALALVTGFISFMMYDSFVCDRIKDFADSEISYTGRITEIRNYADDKSVYRLSGKINSEVKSDIIVYGKTLDCDYYDTLSFSCTPSLFENSFLFNQKDYYESSGCFLKADDISKAELLKNNRFSLRRTVFHYRDYTEKRIDSVLPGQYGALISAMLTGDKSGLDETVKKEMYRCGTGHMMAVSGMHLVLVITLFSGLISRLRISGIKRFVLNELIIILFVIFSGMTVSVVRAAFMMTLICGAGLFGRQTDPLNSLCTASVILLFYEPYLIKNASFLLSVSGTYGAAVFAPYITADMNSDGFFSKLKVKIITVFCISSCVFPFSVMFFDNASVISPLSDIMLIPLCTAALICGLAVPVTGGADIFAYPALIAGGLITKLIFKISSLLSGFGSVTVSLRRNYVPCLTVFLVCFIVFTALKYRNRKYTFTALLISAAVFMISPAVYGFMNKNVLTVYRAGDSRSTAVIVSMGKNTDIIDLTGNARSSQYAAKLAEMYSIHRIDSVSFIKNPYQSMASYSEKFSSDSVSHVYVPENTYTDCDTRICGCSPELFRENGVLSDNGRYRIETDGKNGVKIFYGDTEIICTVSETIAGDGIFKDKNLAVRVSGDGSTDVYKLD